MPELSVVESAKKAAAFRAVEHHLSDSHQHVGIGSGSTVVYVVDAIAAKGADVTKGMTFYPTGDQSADLIQNAGLKLGNIAFLPKGGWLDVCFDGADEVDDELNLIKGGGACLFQEKIVATAAKKFVCVADHRKLSSRLGEQWKKGIPIEVHRLSANRILDQLVKLGSQEPKIRQGGSQKAGPVVTDNGNWLIDAPFKPLLLAGDVSGKPGSGNGEDGQWTVDNLAARLINMVGVIETGLFTGERPSEGGSQRPVTAYFGMEDGSVQMRGQ